MGLAYGTSLTSWSLPSLKTGGMPSLLRVVVVQVCHLWLLLTLLHVAFLKGLEF